MSKSHPAEQAKRSSAQISSLSAVFEAACNALLLAATGFLMGALFIIFATDHGLLYTSAATTTEAYLRAEQTYLMLWTSPLIFKALLHVALLVPIFTLAIKVARYTEAALYFDGVCLGLMMLVLGLYTGSTIPNIRKLASAPSNEQLIEFITNSANLIIPTELDPSSSRMSFFLNKFLVFLSYPATILLNPNKALEREEEFKKSLESNPINDKTRKELLSVTAAGHSIAILLLIGIILLQISKVYAEVEDAKLKAMFKIEESERVSKDRKEQ